MSNNVVNSFLVTSNTDRPYIKQTLFIKFMIDEGYRCYEKNGIKELVRIKDNIIYSESVASAQLFVSNKIAHSEQHSELFLKKPSSFFGSQHVSILPRLDVKILRDTKDECYIPFKNGMVVVTGSSINLVPHNKFLRSKKCYIFEDKIIERDYQLDHSEGDFKKFVRNAVGEDGFPNAARAIGYLIHNYKNPALAKIITFIDIHDVRSDVANGGTGKSLIAKEAIQQIRKSVIFDGKQFRRDDAFKFQGVKPSTDVVVIEDLRKDMDLSVFFNCCTGDFEVRDLHKSSVRIPFEESPKIIITANQGILIRGESEARRICSIGFSGYYNKHKSPMMEFKKLFFSSEWGEGDWSRFYNFMLESVQSYLQLGLDSYGENQVQEKALVQTYGEPIFLAVKAEQDRLTFPHTVQAALIHFESELRMSGVDPTRQYSVICAIMEHFGWLRKSGRMSMYTSWAIPEEEKKVFQTGLVPKMQQRVNWFYKEP